MTKVHVSCVQLRFQMTIPLEELEELAWAAEHHYDAHCRSVAQGLKNRVGFHKDVTTPAHPEQAKEVEIGVNWDDLDTYAKICEQLPLKFPNSQLPKRIGAVFGFMRGMSVELRKAVPAAIQVFKDTSPRYRGQIDPVVVQSNSGHFLSVTTLCSEH